MCDEPDGRPSSTGSVELSRSHIEEIGYLSSSTIMYDKIQNGNMANGFPGNNSGKSLSRLLCLKITNLFS